MLYELNPLGLLFLVCEVCPITSTADLLKDDEPRLHTSTQPPE